ncbi:hypothetical protein predicted by Glimmer/Critica [Bacteroides ovatus V975]|uniref:Uncharacterized protein n=1 Tax=Bacteroides ovatus (strain ATCC 8483 / DSM 1896 / JCM 5824 / BCRC 10623 / CCUG 4943 / NCTC 11153) TaxID=411476 RepID=A0AAN3DC25_BACO1|nr:hypothetical protein BACOVA_00711 [Bacteroides ovatus ATCC 8483]EEO56513.1 hypothetical protein BSCG_03441 [Bacteroides sp. 2_2_4]CAG9869706.1 hypothetical protein BOVAC1_4061 [Bacteroides ovatus]SCV11031.1 hypothetical protein predicted by Glimmer/Critica [Bacteroides ovatus V975]CAG9900179.1 hypothetical protein BOVA713_3642 [Bacteroides ovatus]
MGNRSLFYFPKNILAGEKMVFYKRNMVFFFKMEQKQEK